MDRPTYTSKSLESPTKNMLVYIHAVICMPVMKSTYYTNKILYNFTLNYSGLKITEWHGEQTNLYHLIN